MHGGRAILVGGLAAALAASSPAAAAPQGPSFAIEPGNHAPFFIFRSGPGAVVRSRVTLVNTGSRAGGAQLYAVDATTGQTSGAVYLARSSPRHDVGAWIALSNQRVTLAPGQMASVSFLIRVPANATAGQHLGGLVAEPSQPRTTKVTGRGKRSFRVEVKEISIVAVEVNLPGAQRQQLTIGGVAASGRPGYQTLLIGLTNAGNTLVKGSGTITVDDSSGKGVLSKSFTLDTFVPHTQIQYPVYVTGRRLPAGGYRCKVAIRYGNGHSASRNCSFSISAQALAQTFGSAGSPSAASNTSSVPAWAYALGGVALVVLSIGGTALYFRSRIARRSDG